MTEKITAALGGLIVILEGIERTWLPEENWQNYRRATDALKIEWQRYVEGISPYDASNDEFALCKLFVARSTLIKQEEQKVFRGLTSIQAKGQSKSAPPEN